MGWAAVASAHDAFSRHLRFVGLHACVAMCCTVLFVLPTVARASGVQTETPAATPALPAPASTQAEELSPPTESPPAFPGEATDEEEDYLVRYADGHLTVDVLDMPLEDLLREVGRQSGARVRLEGLGDRKVTDTFTRLALDAALRRLVTGRNFSLTYAEQRDPKGTVIGTRLKELTVYGDTEPVSTPRPGSSGTGPSGPAAAGPGAQGPAPGQTPGERDKAKPATATPNAQGVQQQQPQEHQPAEPPEKAAVDYANPVTAAILGRRGAPREEPAPLEEPVPAQEELLPLPGELPPPLHEGVPPLQEEIPPFQDELPPPEEDFGGEPPLEGGWYPEFDGDDVVGDDGAAHEESGY